MIAATQQGGEGHGLPDRRFSIAVLAGPPSCSRRQIWFGLVSTLLFYTPAIKANAQDGADDSNDLDDELELELCVCCGTRHEPLAAVCVEG